jgi:hypothetical protein
MCGLGKARDRPRKSCSNSPDGAAAVRRPEDRRRADGRGGQPEGPTPPDARYAVKGSLFAGNRTFTGSGAGPALNFRDNDPSIPELVDTKRIDQPIELEMDESKKNYLHPIAGSEAAKVGAGLFLKPSAGDKNTRGFRYENNSNWKCGVHARNRRSGDRYSIASPASVAKRAGRSCQRGWDAFRKI